MVNKSNTEWLSEGVAFRMVQTYRSNAGMELSADEVDATVIWSRNFAEKEPGSYGSGTETSKKVPEVIHLFYFSR